MSAAAFFDFDGTILRGNIVRYYAHLRMQDQRLPVKLLWAAQFLLRIPAYILMDRLRRRWFARRFYRNYRAIKPSDLRRKARVLHEQYLHTRVFSGALERIRWHQRQGHDLVLVTGSIREIVEPLAMQLGIGHILACRLAQRRGSFTGELERGTMTDLEKVRAVRRHCRHRGLSLKDCYGYADSLDDVPMLEQVGYPHVINPGWKLRREARARGWPMLRWRG